MKLQIELKTGDTTQFTDTESKELLMYSSPGESFFIETGFLQGQEVKIIPFLVMVDDKYVSKVEERAGLSIKKLKQLALLLEARDYISVTTFETCPDWVVFAEVLAVGEDKNLIDLEIEGLNSITTREIAT